MGIRFTNEDDYGKFAQILEQAREQNNSLEFF